MIPSLSFGSAEFQFDFTFPCEIHQCFPRAIPDPKNFRVLIHTAEPSPLRWPADEVRKYHGNFDLIITSDEGLKDLPNVEFMIFGDNWVTDKPIQKKFSLSYLHSVGIKTDWDGYKLRDEIWAQRNSFITSAPLDFWYSNNRPPHSNLIEATDKIFPNQSKDLLYESMFSICVENLRERNFFTEKLIDALSTATIPIYYGCTNIGDYFDLDGIINISNPAELSQAIKNLTPNLYWEKLPAITRNMELAKKYHSGFLRVKNLIESKFHSKGKFHKDTNAYPIDNICKSNSVHPFSIKESKGVIIMENSRIDHTSVIGSYTYIGINVGISRAKIGNYCSIANNVNIGQGEHDLTMISTSAIFYDDPYEKLTFGETTISDDVWIGAGATILRGVKIGIGAVVGANAVVTKDVPPYSVVVGVPAKIIKQRFPSDAIEKILNSKWWQYPPADAKLIFNALHQSCINNI
jgi:virginiamycin A acetyltransferase